LYYWEDEHGLKGNPFGREVMKMKAYKKVITLLGLSLLLLVCSKAKNPLKNPPPGFQFEFFQSGCGGGSAEKAGGDVRGDTVIFSSQGDTILVIHKDAFYQCCAQIAVNVVETASGFDLFESDSGDLCDCLCYFDITTTICGLSNGTYFIRVFDIYGDPVDSGVVHIPPESMSSESSQSECRGSFLKTDAKAAPEASEDSVLAWAHAETVWVMHKNAFENCCSIILSEVERTLEGFDLFEYDAATHWCRCMCYFDLTTTIYGVSPGVYLIRVFDTSGELLGGVELVIPPV